MLATVLALPLAARSPDGLAGVVERAVGAVTPRPLRRRLPPERVGAAIRAGLWNVRHLTAQPALLARCVAWAAANWLLDAAVLALAAVTLGAGTPLTSLLLVYVLGRLAAAVSLTPGGVGVVEATMTAAFVATGAPAAAAAATVLGWRLISHWLPILVGVALLPTIGRPPPDAAPAAR